MANVYTILEMNNGEVTNVISYQENKREEAEDYFREVIQENNLDITEQELEMAVIDGYSELGAWIVYLLVSELL